MKGIFWILAIFLLALPLSYADTSSIRWGDTANLGDTYIAEDVPTANYATGVVIQLRDNSVAEDDIGFIIWEISNLTGKTIINATLRFNIVTLNSLQTYNFSEIFGGYDINNITWTTDPCQVANNCNATPAISKTFSATGNNSVELTNALQQAVNRGRSNYSLSIRKLPPTINNHITQLSSKESVDTSLRPYFDVTFEIPAVASLPNLTATATDLYDGSSLNFSLSLKRGGIVILNQTTTNGTIPIANITNGMANLTFQSTQAGGYFERTYNNVNVSGQAFVGQLYQAILYLNASQLISGTQITNFGAAAPLQYNQSNSSGWTKLFLKAGNYNITGNTTGYINTTNSVSISALSESFSTLIFASNRLRIDARSIITNAFIQNFTILLYNGSYSSTSTTTTGNATFDLVSGTYYLNFSSTTHANMNASIVMSSSSMFPNYTFSVYTTNSLNLSIWDEVLGKPNTFFNNRSVLLQFIGTLASSNYTTLTGSIYVDLLTPQEYRVRYSSDAYTPRNYYFTLLNRSNNYIDLYLLSTGNSTNVVITIQDNTGNVLEGSTVYLQRYYVTSNTYETVAMEKTNAEGQVVFNTDFNNAFYKIVAIYGNFQTSTIGAKIFQTTITLTIDTQSNPFSELDDVQSISSYITFNNATATFTLNAVNREGTALPFTLDISQISGTGAKTNVCSSTSTFSSGAILCVYNVSQHPGTYVAEGFVGLSGYVPDMLISSITYVSSTLQREAVAIFGNDGLFYSMILTGSFTLLGAGAGPVGALVGFMIGIGGSLALGLAFFGSSGYSSLIVFVSLFIVAGGIIWRISR